MQLRIRPMISIAILALLTAYASAALALNKCEADGKITYTEAPCPGAKTLDTDNRPAADIASAKQRAAKEKTDLKRIEVQRAKSEAQQARTDQAAARLAKVQDRKAAKCDKLALRKQWAEEDAAKASGKTQEKAKTRAHRAGQAYTLACRK